MVPVVADALYRELQIGEFGVQMSLDFGLYTLPFRVGFAAARKAGAAQQQDAKTGEQFHASSAVSLAARTFSSRWLRNSL